MKVIVEIKEVHSSTREIEVPDDATDAEIREAAERDAFGADELDLEYSHTLPSETWTVRKEHVIDFTSSTISQLKNDMDGIMKRLVKAPPGFEPGDITDIGIRDDDGEVKHIHLNPPDSP